MSAPDPVPEVRTSSVSMQELLEAGIHFGHQTRRWHPHMKPFLYGERNGVHIIDLQHTLPRFREACEFARELVASGGTLLFVGTKRQAQEIVAEEAKRCAMPYVHRRWLGGMLTNFRTIQKGISRYKELTALLADEENEEGLSKKERSRLTREHLKLHKAFEGMVEMEPAARRRLRHRHQAGVHRGQGGRNVYRSRWLPWSTRTVTPKASISRCRATTMRCAQFGSTARSSARRVWRGPSCSIGASSRRDKGKPEEAEGAEAPKHGKRVVEITQPARRPARMERMAEERRKELEESPEPAGEAVEAAPTEAAPTEGTPTEGTATVSAPIEDVPTEDTPAEVPPGGSEGAESS